MYMCELNEVRLSFLPRDVAVLMSLDVLQAFLY